MAHQQRSKTKGIGHRKSLSAVLMATCATGIAGAQEAASSAPEDAKVVITGTRLVNRGFLAPTPVTVLDAQELKVTGTQNLETLLTDTPQFTANQLSSPTANTMQAGQPSGTATLNLR